MAKVDTSLVADLPLFAGFKPEELEEIPDEETLERLGERWAPYRSMAAMYLWESLDNKPAI